MSASPLTFSSADLNVTLPDFFLPEVGYYMSGGIHEHAGDPPSSFVAYAPLATGTGLAATRTLGAIDATSTAAVTSNPGGTASVHLSTGGQISDSPANSVANFVSTSDAWLKAVNVPQDGLYDISLSYNLLAEITSLAGRQSFAQIQATLFSPGGIIALPVYHASLLLGDPSSGVSALTGGFDQQFFLEAGKSYSLRLQVTAQQHMEVADAGSTMALVGGAMLLLLLRRRLAG